MPHAGTDVQKSQPANSLPSAHIQDDAASPSHSTPDADLHTAPTSSRPAATSPPSLAITNLQRAATATTSLAAQAAAALHPPTDYLTHEPDEDDHFDADDDFIFNGPAADCPEPAVPADDRDAVSAPQMASKRDVGRAVTIAEPRVKQDCPDEGGPETPASAEKHACIIIRYTQSQVVSTRVHQKQNSMSQQCMHSAKIFTMKDHDSEKM